MARSHPPTLLTLARATLRAEVKLAPGAHVLAAVSGGLDSMTLLHALSCLAPKLGFRLSAHGVDHGLRSEASAELDLAEQFARSLAVPFARTHVALARGGNLQARARTLRYQALREAAARIGADRIATAHHADDRAETVLLRLLRGTSPRGLAILPACEGDLVRPFLRASRADIAAHGGRHGVPFAEDPSNRDHKFLRTRVRHELLPLLRELSPGIVAHLNALADEQRQLMDATPMSFLLPSTAEEGGKGTLGRAQRQQLRRMLSAPAARASVRLSGGRELTVDPKSREIRVTVSELPDRGD